MPKSLQPGMRVVFAIEVLTPTFKTARAFESARLVQALDVHPTPRPDDRFEVEFRGERFVVQRKEIALQLRT